MLFSESLFSHGRIENWQGKEGIGFYLLCNSQGQEHWEFQFRADSVLSFLQKSNVNFGKHGL